MKEGKLSISPPFVSFHAMVGYAYEDGLIKPEPNQYDL